MEEMTSSWDQEIRFPFYWPHDLVKVIAPLWLALSSYSDYNTSLTGKRTLGL